MNRILFSLSLLLASTVVRAAPVELDVLVLYTPGTEAKYGTGTLARFDHLMAVTNQIYSDSGVNARVRVVAAKKVAYTDANNAEQALRDMTQRAVPAFANVSSWRQQYGADLVVLYRPYSDVHGSCGIAWVGGNGTNGNLSGMKETAYAHVAVDTCGDYVTAHEFGHNMGLLHSRRQDGKGGTFHYALGHGEYGKFTTIMAYQSSFGVDYVAGKVWKFSSPLTTCAGRPCGIDKNNTTSGADAVSTLNVTIPQVAQYSPRMVEGSAPVLNGSVVPVVDPMVADLQARIQQAQTKLQQVQQAYNTVLATYNANKKAIDAAKAAVTTTYNAAQKAVAAVNTAANKYQQVVMKGGSAATIQSAYNAYVKAANTANAAIANYGLAQQKYAAYGVLLAQLDQAKALLAQATTELASLQKQLQQLMA